MMNTFLLGVFLLLSSHAHAEIYKCKDNEGVINFTSTPCGEKNSGIKRPVKKAAPLNEDGSKKSAKQIIKDRMKKEKEFLQAAKRQRLDEKKKKDKLNKHNDKLKKNCNRAKRDLSKYQRAQYLYDKGKDGKRNILSDEQRKKAEIEAQRRVTYWCRQ